MILALLSGALLVLFGGITDRLIPLFAVGAFTAFTLSQAGMILHWKRSREPHARHSMILNVIGAVATGTALIVITVAKFTEGAWLTILVMPPLIFVFFKIRWYHEKIEREVDEDIEPLDPSDIPTPVFVVPIKRLNRVTRKALRVALSFGVDVHVVQIVAEEVGTDDLSAEWQELVEEPVRKSGQRIPKLVVIKSPYREFFGPLVEYVNQLSRLHPQSPIAVVVPELVEKRWYNFLFRHRATLLKELLLVSGGPYTLVLTAPWYLGKKDKYSG